MSMLFDRRFYFPLGLVLAALLAINLVGADDNKKEEGKAVRGVADAKVEVKAEATRSPEELFATIRALSSQKPEGKTREEMIANYLKIQRAISETASQLLTASDMGEEADLQMAVVAIQTKTQSLRTLEQMGDDKAHGELVAFVKELATHKQSEIQEIAALIDRQVKFSVTPHTSEDHAKEIVAELKKEFGEGEIEPQMIGLIMESVSGIGRLGYNDIAADVNSFFSERFAKSDNPQIIDLSKKMAGAVRRFRLLGNPIKISGTLLDGKQLDWAAYKGKVILIDYWATWCGPCIQELPNVLENYEKYHDKGFDVLGISLDTDRDAVQDFVDQRELPWPTLFSDDPEANGWNHPMADQYGISGIPAVILVDQEGNVVSLNARGPELGEALAKLLGPVKGEETAEDGDGDTHP